MTGFDFSGPISGKQVIHRIIAASAICLIFVVSVSATPEQLPLPVCLFKKLTGYSCPSCGMTHSFHAFAVGRPGPAFHYNRMGPFLFVLLMLLFLKLSLELVTQREIRMRRPKIPLRIACLLISGLWMAFWAVRFSSELEYARNGGQEPPRAGGSLNAHSPPDGDLVRGPSPVPTTKQNSVAHHDKP